MSSFSIFKMFKLRITVFKNNLKKYKVDLILDLVFIILELFLQIIND